MSASTKLPTPSGSVGTWGAELNDFLGQSMVASTTAGATNGLLKTDHAAITDGGKVGIGTGSPVTIFEVKNQGAGVATTTLGGQTTISGTDSSSSSAFNYGTTEDTYLRSGKASSNMYIQDQPGAGDTRINPKNGNLAVGTSSAPVKKLDVAGGIRSSVDISSIYYYFDNTTLPDGSAQHDFTYNVAKYLVTSIAYQDKDRFTFLTQDKTTATQFDNIPMRFVNIPGTGQTKIILAGTVAASNPGLSSLRIVQGIPDYATTALATADTLLISGDVYSVTTSGIKALYIK